MNPRKFFNASFKASPHAGEVGDRDLLVYITQASSILRMMNKVFEPDIEHQLPAGHIGGATKKMPDGRVLSEVFWTGGLMSLNTSTSDRHGIALANFIFHEWAHNKHTSDPVARSKGEDADGGSYVHHYCGGGVLAGGLSYGRAASLDINTTNISSMARVLDASNQQSVSGLYSDDLGF